MSLRIIINQAYCSRANDDLTNTIRSKYIQLSLSVCQIKWPVMVPVCLLQERNEPALVLNLLSNRQKIKANTKLSYSSHQYEVSPAPNSTDCWIHLHCAAHRSYNCPFTAFSLLHPVHIFQSVCCSQREKKQNKPPALPEVIFITLLVIWNEEIARGYHASFVDKVRRCGRRDASKFAWLGREKPNGKEWRLQQVIRRLWQGLALFALSLCHLALLAY